MNHEKAMRAVELIEYANDDKELLVRVMVVVVGEIGFGR